MFEAPKFDAADQNKDRRAKRRAERRAERRKRRPEKRKKLQEGVTPEEALLEMEERVIEKAPLEDMKQQINDLFLEQVDGEAIWVLGRQLELWQADREEGLLGPEEEALLEEIERYYQILHKTSLSILDRMMGKALGESNWEERDHVAQQLIGLRADNEKLLPIIRYCSPEYGEQAAILMLHRGDLTLDELSAIIWSVPRYEAMAREQYFQLYDNDPEIVDRMVAEVYEGNTNKQVWPEKIAAFKELVAYGIVVDREFIRCFPLGGERPEHMANFKRLHDAGIIISSSIATSLNFMKGLDDDYVDVLLRFHEAEVKVDYDFIRGLRVAKAHDAQHIEALLALHEVGVEIDSDFLYTFRPELSHDEMYMKAVLELANMGVSLEGIFWRDFSPEDVANEPYVNTLKKLAKAGIRVRFSDIPHEIDRLSDEERGQYVETLIDLDKAGIEIDKEHSFFIPTLRISLALDQPYVKALKILARAGVPIEGSFLAHFNLSEAYDRRYVDNLIILSDAGVDLNSRDFMRGLSREKGVDDVYVSHLIRLKGAGIAVDKYEFCRYLTLEKGRNETYINTLIELHEAEISIGAAFVSRASIDKLLERDYVELLLEFASLGLEVSGHFVQGFSLNMARDPRFVELLKENAGDLNETRLAYLAEDLGEPADELRIHFGIGRRAYYGARDDIQPEIIALNDFKRREGITPLTVEFIDKRLSRRLLRVVRQMNDLHNAGDARRLEAVEGMSADLFYEIVVLGNQEVYTSTFRLLFDRMLQEMQQDGLDGATLIERADPHQRGFRILIRTCAQYGRLEDFLDTIKDSQKREALLRDFIKGLPDSANPLADGVTISETFAEGMSDELSIILEEHLKEAYEQQEEGSETQMIYGLIASLHARTAKSSPDWFREIEQKYPTVPSDALLEHHLFNENGLNVQHHFFYNDEDGESSYRHFMDTYADWHKENHETYVVLQKKRGDRTVIIYANKPEADEEGPLDIMAMMSEKEVSPQVIVHRGHSYHVGKTLRYIEADTTLVSLGSCGGFNNVSNVLSRSPMAHILATKGTGTMYVNDPLFKMMNEEMLGRGNIHWADFWRRADSRIHDKRFDAYVPPHKNAGITLIQAFRALQQQP